MSLIHVPFKTWSAECPKCHHIELSHVDGTTCDNCGAPAIMTYPSGTTFENEEAKLSWRRLECTNHCGWSAHRVQCSKCGTMIQGAWFRGKSQCFVATAAFDSEDHPIVDKLRVIRDSRLSKSRSGRRFIQFYYLNGPSLARLVNRFPSTKPVIKIILTAIAKIFSR